VPLDPIPLVEQQLITTTVPGNIPSHPVIAYGDALLFPINAAIPPLIVSPAINPSAEGL
jgi:hypothetical protein